VSGARFWVILATIALAQIFASVGPHGIVGALGFALAALLFMADSICDTIREASK
jgi:hypothetical protein